MKSFLSLNNALPGIVALFAFSPDTAAPMSALAQVLLHNPHPTLTRGEREYIAAIVSRHNKTEFCHKSHRAFCEKNLHEEGSTTFQKLENITAETARTSHMRAIALCVADNSPKATRSAAETALQRQILTEREVHDVALIAAAFAMYNRYVNCLVAPLPPDEAYAGMAEGIYENGYVQPVDAPSDVEATL